MATRPKAVIESHDGEKLSPITITKNVLTDNGKNLHDILSNRKEDMITPTIENSSSMFKVGQGDSVDYSENVVDGAYESCVLKGVTKFIDNNTGEILDSFVEDRDLSLIDCKSPILSNVGKNLFDGNFVVGGLSTVNGSYDASNKDWTVTDYINVSNMKGITFSSSLSFNVANFVYFKYDKNKNYLGYTGIYNSSSIASISLEEDVCYVRFRVPSAIPNNSKFQIEEGMIATPYESYKSNILSANGDKIELTEDMFEQGTVSGANGIGTKYEVMKENSAVRLRSKDIIRVKPNTSYRLFREDGYDGWCVAFDSNQRYLGKSYKTETFVTDSQTHYIVPVLKNINNTTMLLEHIAKFKLSEVDKTIVLRSLPGDVCDTLNVETGEYTRKIGEIIIDGSENWKLSTRFSSTYNSYYFVLNEAYKNKMKCISDKYQILLGGEDLGKNIGLHMGRDDNNIAPFISSDKMTLSEFKEYLQQNPVTVQYELATPIVSTVDIQGFSFSYKNGHVQLSSGSIEQSLTPKVEYSVVTNRNGQIRSNQKMVERHQKQLDRLQAMVLTNLVNTQYEQTLTNLKYDLKNVREEVK